MARPIKKGINFYSMDVGFIYDSKIRLLKKRQGAEGVWVYLCIISEIYGNDGYYMDLSDNDKLELFAGDVIGMNTAKAGAIIKYMVEAELFSLEKWNEYKILTSRRVQQNFIFATKDRRKKGTVIKLYQEYLLVSVEEENIRIINLSGKDDKIVFPVKNEVIPVKNEVIPVKNNIPPVNNGSFSQEEYAKYNIIQNKRKENSVC